ncbi:MAG: dynamin family protein [Victivallales bacterium]|nr:dynamin family protein [Victivallales bacterium]
MLAKTTERYSPEEHTEAVSKILFRSGTGFPMWLQEFATNLATKYGGVQTTREFNTALRTFTSDKSKPFELFVVGEGNFGKSTLVNAFLGQELSKVHFLPETRSFLRFVALKTVDDKSTLFVRKEKGVHDWMTSQIGNGTPSKDLYEITEHQVSREVGDNILAEEAKRFKQDKSGYPLAVYEYETAFKHTPKCIFPPGLRLVDTQGLNQMFPKELIDESEKLDISTTGKRFEEWLNKTSRGKHLEWQFRRCDAVLWLAHARKSNSAATLAALRYFRQYGKVTVLAVTNLDRIQGGDEARTKVLAKIHETYGEYVTSVIPVNGKLAMEGVVESDKNKIAESGFYEITRYLTKTCIEKGDLVRSIGRYNSMRTSESQLHNALGIQESEYNYCIDLLASHRLYVSNEQKKERTRLISFMKVSTDECVVMLKRNISRINWQDDQTSVPGKLRVNDVSAALHGKSELFCKQLYDYVNSCVSAMGQEEYKLPTFDAEGARAHDSIRVEMRVREYRPELPRTIFSISLQKMGFFDRAKIWALEKLGVLFSASREKAENMKEDATRQNQQVVTKQVMALWIPHTEKTQGVLDKLVVQQFSQLNVRLDEIEKELEVQEGRALIITANELGDVLKDRVVPQVVPTVFVNMLRKKLGSLPYVSG